ERQEYWWEQILRQVQEPVEPEALAGEPPPPVGGHPHPGEILAETLKCRGITPYRVACAIGLDQIGVSRILRGLRSITPATALRLARFLGTTPEYWMSLQSAYDLEQARAAGGEELERIEPLRAQEAVAAGR